MAQTRFKQGKKLLASVLAAAVLVPAGLMAVSAETPEDAISIDGSLSITGNTWQVDYVIPADAPETVVLDGRDLMDALIRRGDYNGMWPGTWTGSWMTLLNQSAYEYEVVDVTFGLDHSQQKQDSDILKDLEYNPYEIGRDFFATGRPESIRNYATGAKGFDGYDIPGSLTVLRSNNSAIQSYYGASSITLEKVLSLDAKLREQNKTYSQYLAEYYSQDSRYAFLLGDVSSFAELPLYCLTDSLCGPSYAMWTTGDPTGQNRWQLGDVKLHAAIDIPLDDKLWRRVMVDVYDKYDENNNPHYYYVDKNEFGVSTPDVEIDTASSAFEYVDASGFMTENCYFRPTQTGDLTGLAEMPNYWQDEDGNYLALETDPAVVARAYDSFYTDMLSFTFDSKKYPLQLGRRDAYNMGDYLEYTEYTEGSDGMHYADYLNENAAAKQVIDNTVGSWVIAPAGSDGDWLSTYTNLKLSGQNTTNNFAGTEFMRGLTFQVTLKRVVSEYRVEYYKDSVSAENLLNDPADDTFTAAVNSTVDFDAALLNKYLPEQGGYQNGALAGENAIVIQKDPAENVFQVLYARSPYTVTYNPNGGTGTQVDASSPYFAGDSVTVLGQGNVSRENYSFLGWNTQADGQGTTYQAGGVFVMPKNNVVLYAMWEAIEEEFPEEDPPLNPPDEDPEDPPVDNPPEEEFPEEDTPLNPPGTGASSVIPVAGGAAVLAAAAMAVLVLRRKKEQE